MRRLTGLFVGYLCYAALAQAEVYSVGVVPQFDARQLYSTWQPLLDAVTTQSKIELQLMASPNIAVFEQQFSIGKFDFVYLNPYHCLLANQAQGYLPVLRDHAEKLQGILLVRKDSGITQVQQLSGQEIAFPSPNALGASLLIRAELTRLGVQFIPKYVKNHSSVYLNVALGQVKAGGGIYRTWQMENDDLEFQLRVLYRTREIAPHPLCVHPRVPKKVRDAVVQALLDLGQSPQGQRLLAAIPIQSIGPATLDDYAPLRELGLEKFVQRE
ncbi:MAG: phosphate/phosphite/phosphonate ABC transporter substrate-binding protein [Gammaproteobacteria bacterium]|nr:phosphate/phosphite/phosphonate ABC transporter substrate-binding protein [Gammaproteobacteria bacterium]